jgi:hypothetical protein
MGAMGWLWATFPEKCATIFEWNPENSCGFDPKNGRVGHGPCARQAIALDNEENGSRMNPPQLTSAEFEAILADPTKRIEGDISWQEDEDHSPSMDFRVEIQSDAGWPLFARGSYNPLIPALSFTLILKTAGRVYGLDLGKDHHNPQCDRVGETHKHRWTERLRDKEAYVPEDICADPSEPLAVWEQFCREANLRHEGKLQPPPPIQGEMFS